MAGLVGYLSVYFVSQVPFSTVYAVLRAGGSPPAWLVDMSEVLVDLHGLFNAVVYGSMEVWVYRSGTHPEPGKAGEGARHSQHLTLYSNDSDSISNRPSRDESEMNQLHVVPL